MSYHAQSILAAATAPLVLPVWSPSLVAAAEVPLALMLFSLLVRRTPALAARCLSLAVLALAAATCLFAVALVPLALVAL
jgi:hypothetical protein